MKIAIDDANVQAAVDDAVEMHAAMGNSVENDSRVVGDVARSVDAMSDEVHADDLVGTDIDGDDVPDIDIDGDGIADYDVDGTPLHDELEDEEAMVEAAKRAGEQAAEAELAAAADAADEAARNAAAQAGATDEADVVAAAEAVVAGAAAEALNAARAKAAEATDRLARLQADWENFRRRTAAERLAERDRAAEDLVVALLPVLDDMERAVSHAAVDDSCVEGSSFAQFVEGVSAVHDKMLAILDHAGVSVINPAGEPFDPLEAQAVGRVENADVYADTVADVYQPGYRMGGKVIRSAMVTVTYGGPARPADEKETK